ncbi:hypothetical protein [Pseudomonas sp. GM80]|uniref:hypothetical protein n=1 Tax=Pseudomonas sp. GM80 TaxID=1144339 RepID=UPI00026FB80C|nr:hypothetical protein [Pseudomonas sp. GM80]EJN18242.1 hypothetical protein PMI37_05880 [Pseudomonas sp. GM80]
MAHLTDMEELLSTISQTDIRDYMRESMSCYMAGAYRGSIVLSYIALFDDLLGKLNELSRVNAAAKTVYDEAFKKKNDQDVYENFLIDQLTSKSLISGLDGAFLTTLRILRNKSAHPSGHKPSAEEARFIFFETISRFLSRPILSTTQLVDELINRLGNAIFFPSLDITEIQNIVNEETLNLHAEALPQLVAKLTTSVLSADINISANAVRFLLGLAKGSNIIATKAIQAKILEAKADDSAYSDLIIQLLSADGKLFLGLSTACVGRIRSAISKSIEALTSSSSETKLIHPANALSSVATELADGELLKYFKVELEKLINKRPYSQNTINLVARNKAALSPIYFPELLSDAGSSSFSTANTFANVVDSIDSSLSKLLSDEECFQLIVAISKAADYGAWSSAALEAAKYSSVPQIRSKALDYINLNKQTAETYLAKNIRFQESADKFIESFLTDKA